MKSSIVFLQGLLLLWFVASPALSTAQTAGTTNSPSPEIVEILETLNTDYSQQKVYLHTDKDSYMAGEHIWYTSYVVDAINHEPDGSANNLHVELLNSQGDFISISLIPVQDGYSYGDVFLPDSIPEGNYFLRAYTDWMRNFDEDFYYQREIYVYNPIEENFIRRREIRQNRRYNRDLEDKQNTMQFAIFPEGGELIANLENRVAFKAANQLGAGMEARGVVKDSNGNTVKEFETFHDGMGVFEITPEANKEYVAEIYFGNGEELSYSFPESLNQGYLLKADVLDDKININVKSNFNPASVNIAPELTVIVHTRNKVIFHEKAQLDNNIYNASISKDKFNTGISHITVFDANMLPVSERLVFINHNDISKAQINNFDNLDKLEIEFEGYSNEEDVYGSYSLSAIKLFGKEAEHESNIASYLLLESDLGTTFKNPWYYLSGNNQEIKKALDLLMMTHGWRRFDWEELAKGRFPEIEHEPTVGIKISGRLLTLRDSRPVEEVPVELAINQHGVDIYTTNTSSGGRFSFEGLHYEGSFNAILTPGQIEQTVIIDLDDRDYRKANFEKTFLSEPRQILSRGDDWSRTSRPEIKDEHFEAPDFKKELEGSKRSYGQADQVIYIDDLPSGYTNLSSALRGRLISLGADASFHASNEPLYILDDSPIGGNAFWGLNPQNIEKVEVFRGASTTVWGVRGANGVLVAYSRTAATEQKAEFEFTYFGYDTPNKFYESKINTEDFKQAGVSKTLFWEPQIIPNENGLAKIELSSNLDFKNSVILIEGIDNKGRITYTKIQLD